MTTDKANEQITDDVRKTLERQQYRIAGRHSAVKICNWTKRSLRGEGSCYKQKFYGIQSHRCLQMTPAVAWCTNRCVYCWRAIEKTLGNGMEGVGLDEPGDIIDACIESQRKLLSGFKGFGGVDLHKWLEAQEPNQAAISLAGEPTLYPRIAELILEFRKRKFSTFLVTNGQLPERLEGIEEPTNLYISLDAPDRETYRKTDCPSFPDFWQRLEKSLELMNSFSCAKVLRLTLVKGINMKNPEGYADLIKKASPDYIEVKGYMFVGFSRKRLDKGNMPLFREVKAFSEKVMELTGYGFKDEQKESRVILLSNK
jgi:tRNA wybutosine-synthesizing protein 1